jgi:hypothetical protein
MLLRDLSSDAERDATRERLAVIVVTLGKSCHQINAVELQGKALAMLDNQKGAPQSEKISRIAPDEAQHNT